MAIELQNTLKTFYAAHDCIELEFLMDDIGTAPDKKWMAYYVSSPDDIMLVDQQDYIKPYAIDKTFIRDLKSVAENLVRTSIPDLSLTTYEDTEIIRGIKLKYGEVLFNGETCNTTVDFSLETDVMYILNASLQQKEKDYFSGTTPVLLQHRDLNKILYKGQYDFFYVLGAGKVTVKFYEGQTLVSTTVHEFTDDYKVNVVNVSPHLYGQSNSEVTKAEVLVIHSTLLEDTLINQYNIFYKDVCKDTENIGIIYLDSYGGRQALPLNKIIKKELITKGDEVQKAFDSESEAFEYGGASLINMVNKDRKQFRMQMNYSLNNLEVIRQFFSSAGKFIQSGTGTDAVLNKCILENGTYVVYEDSSLIDVKFNVVMSEEKKTQKQDR